MFKTVLVHLTGSICDQSVLATGLQLVRPFEGHIDCLRTVPDPVALAAQAMQLDTGMTLVLADMQSMEKEAQAGTQRAQLTMREFCKAENVLFADAPPGPHAVSAAWRERKTTDEWDEISRLARFHDVVVLSGGRERAGRSPMELLGSIIVGSGRPVILAPEDSPQGPFKTIAVAWKETPEAARAMTAAMPLLAKAARIEILVANEENTHTALCLDRSESVVRQLRWHGLEAHNHAVIPSGRTVPDAILERAQDLLVMGGYGHSRLREFVFGGFTRRILEGVDLPVFLFH